MKLEEKVICPVCEEGKLIFGDFQYEGIARCTNRKCNALFFVDQESGDLQESDESILDKMDACHNDMMEDIYMGHDGSTFIPPRKTDRWGNVIQ